LKGFLFLSQYSTFFHLSSRFFKKNHLFLFFCPSLSHSFFAPFPFYLSSAATTLPITLYVFACAIQDIGAASKTNTPFQDTIQQQETRKAFNKIKNRSFSNLKYKTSPPAFSTSQCFFLCLSSTFFFPVLSYYS